MGQVVSLKMVLEPEGMLERINAALPGQVRVQGWAGRVAGGVLGGRQGRLDKLPLLCADGVC